MIAAIKKAWPWLGLSIVVVLLDQWSKYWAVHHLVIGEPWVWLPFLNLMLNINAGAAFSFLGNAGGWQVYLFSAISWVVAGILTVGLWGVRRSDYLMAIGMSLILGGALGNGIDRVRLFYVIDFFDFHVGAWHFATFNVADSAICIGAVLLIIRFLWGQK
ncbi:MAG: signal peptidase II [Coxiella sp. RIFCSPHIGHO2_12_FULL_44_14]|nr:MAG: signal peptidase II [Coxiella sp. RIFCSPHIGHO2_12_FULL_44_14]